MAGPEIVWTYPGQEPAAVDGQEARDTAHGTARVDAHPETPGVEERPRSTQGHAEADERFSVAEGDDAGLLVALDDRAPSAGPAVLDEADLIDLRGMGPEGDGGIFR